jgi:hypothetical protein
MANVTQQIKENKKLYCFITAGNKVLKEDDEPIKKTIMNWIDWYKIHIPPTDKRINIGLMMSDEKQEEAHGFAYLRLHYGEQN